MAVCQTTCYVVKLALGHSAYDRYNGNRKRGRTIAELDINNWETAASNRGNWRSVVKTGMQRGEERKRAQLPERRALRKQRVVNVQFSSESSMCVCSRSGRDRHARFRLLSHTMHITRLIITAPQTIFIQDRMLTYIVLM